MQRYNTDNGTNWNVYFPPPSLCTDNGVMVAWSAIRKFTAGISDCIAEDAVDVIARWPLGAHVGNKVEAVLKEVKDEEKKARKEKYSTRNNCEIASASLK